MGRTKKIDSETAYLMPFPTRLRGLLDRPGETQGKLADSIGANRQSIGQWKDGITAPDIYALNKIADYFGVSTDYLLGRVDVKSPEISNIVINEKTGLSDEAITVFSSFASDDYYIFQGVNEGSGVRTRELISALIDDDHFCTIIEAMSKAIVTKIQYEKSRSNGIFSPATPFDQSEQDDLFYYWKVEHTVKDWAASVLKSFYEENHSRLEHIYQEQLDRFHELYYGEKEKPEDIAEWSRELRESEKKV